MVGRRRTVFIEDRRIIHFSICIFTFVHTHYTHTTCAEIYTRFMCTCACKCTCTYTSTDVQVFILQKRPIHMAKETYSQGKRDLFTWQRPIHIQVQMFKSICMTHKKIGPMSCSFFASTCIFVYVHICTCAYTCIYVHIHVSMYMHKFMYIDTCTCT